MLDHRIELELPIKRVVLFESNPIELTPLRCQSCHEEIFVDLGQRKGLIIDSRIELQVVVCILHKNGTIGLIGNFFHYKVVPIVDYVVTEKGLGKY